MRIVHVLYELGSGGAERFVVDLANCQAAQGHRVTVCMLRPIDGKNDFCARFLSDQVEFVCLGISSGLTVGKLRKVAGELLARCPDVLHAHHNVLPYLALLIFRRNRPVIIHTIHSDAHRANANVVERCYCKFLYRKKWVRPVTISAASDDSFFSVYGVRAFCIPNGREKIAPGEALNVVKKEIESYGQGVPVFVHTGRCHPVKNQRLLVDAFNALKNKGEKFTLLVIGAGYDSELGQALKDMACDRIFFLGEKENVGDYLLCADAFCLTSLSEGLPISLLEALACGVTPICTPVGGIQSVVTDGETGYLSKDLTRDSYLDAIDRYMKQPVPRAVLQHYFEENYSMRKCCERYLSFYDIS